MTIYQDSNTYTTTYTDAQGKEVIENEYLKAPERTYGNLEKHNVTFLWHEMQELVSQSKDKVSGKL